MGKGLETAVGGRGLLPGRPAAARVGVRTLAEPGRVTRDRLQPSLCVHTRGGTARCTPPAEPGGRAGATVS